MWNGLIVYWGRDDVKARSEAARRARFSDPGGPGTGYSTHYGGTSCVAVKAQKMVKEKRISIRDCMHESYLTLYYKNGKYTTKRAAEIDAKVKEIAGRQGEGANLNDIFVNDVMGGRLDKKKRMLGTGVLGPMLMGSHSMAASTSNQQHDAKWKSEMQQNLNEERERRMKLEEDMIKMQKIVGSW